MPRRRLVHPLLHQPLGMVAPAWPWCPVQVRAGEVMGTCIAPPAGCQRGQDRDASTLWGGWRGHKAVGGGGHVAGRGWDGGAFPFWSLQQSFPCVVEAYPCCPQQLIPTALKSLKTSQLLFLIKHIVIVYTYLIIMKWQPPLPFWFPSWLCKLQSRLKGGRHRHSTRNCPARPPLEKVVANWDRDINAERSFGKRKQCHQDLFL